MYGTTVNIADSWSNTQCLNFMQHMVEKTSLPLQADLITTRISIPYTFCPLGCYTLCYLRRSTNIQKHLRTQSVIKFTLLMQEMTYAMHKHHMKRLYPQYLQKHTIQHKNLKEYIPRWHWCDEAACRPHDTSSPRLYWYSHLGWIVWPEWSFHTLFLRSPLGHGSNWSGPPAPEDGKLEVGERKWKDYEMRR